MEKLERVLVEFRKLDPAERRLCMAMMRYEMSHEKEKPNAKKNA